MAALSFDDLAPAKKAGPLTFDDLAPAPKVTATLTETPLQSLKTFVGTGASQLAQAPKDTAKSYLEATSDAFSQARDVAHEGVQKMKSGWSGVLPGAAEAIRGTVGEVAAPITGAITGPLQWADPGAVPELAKTPERVPEAPPAKIAERPRIEPIPPEVADARAAQAGQQATEKATTRTTRKPVTFDELASQRPPAPAPASPEQKLASAKSRSGPVAIEDIKPVKPAKPAVAKTPSIRDAVEKAYLSATGGAYNKRGLLSDIRKQLSGFSREEVDAEIRKLQSEGHLTTAPMDNRLELLKHPEWSEAAIDVGGEKRPIVWMPKKLGPKPQSVGAAAIDRNAIGKPAALPAKEMNGTTRKLSDDLYRTLTKHEKVKLEVLDEVKKLPPEAQQLGEKFFNYLEPGPNKPQLSAEERGIFDKYLKPWLERQRDLYDYIKKQSPELLGDYDPDYVHHLVKGKTPEFDEQIGQVSHEPNSPWFGGRTLPRSTRSLEASKYYTMENGQGGTQLVSIDDKGNAYKIQGGQPVNIPAHDFKGEFGPGEKINYAGQEWTIRRASVAEKEAGTKLRYYKNAYLSTLSNVTRLEKVADALHFFETMKNDPEFMQFARAPGDKRPTPKGWDKTTLPGWESYKFDRRMREVLDDFHRKPGEAWYENLKNLSHGVVGTLFLTPFRHMLNVAGHFYVGRGWGWAPQGWQPFIKNTGLALYDTLHQGPFTRQMLQEGSALQLPRTLNADFNKQLLTGLQSQMKNNPKDWKWLWNKLNVKEEDIYNGWMKASSVAMWYFSDVLMQSLVRERMSQGMNMTDAIRSAEKDIPNYRINSRVMGSRMASRYLQNNLFGVFGAYNNNKWRAVSDMVQDLVGPERRPKERAEAVGKALALASLVYFVGWPLTSAVQQLTGRKDKRASPFGPVSVMDQLKQAGELITPKLMKRLGATDDQVHATQLLQSLLEPSPLIDTATEQLTGHNPYTNEQVNTLGERAQALGGSLNPLQVGSDIVGGKASPLEELLKMTIGERSTPKPPPAHILTQQQRAEQKRANKQPINKFERELERKLHSFAPDAMINKFLPSQ